MRSRLALVIVGSAVFCAMSLFPARLAGAETPALIPVPMPNTASLDPEVRTALESAQTRFQTMSERQAQDLPALAQSFAEWAGSLHAHDQTASARVAYQNALRLQPDRFDWSYQLALLELGVADTDAALAQLDRAIALNKDYPAAWIRRGDLHLNRGEIDAAEADYQQALKLAPASAAAHAGLGQAAAQQDRHEEAARQLELALVQQPQATRLHTALALNYRSLGKIEQARQQLALRGDQPVRIEDPIFDAVAALARNAVAFYEQARAMDKAGRSAEALTLLAKAVELAPEDATYLRAYGQQLFDLGRKGEAREMLERAWKIDPETPTVALLLARLDVSDGALDTAREHYQVALRLDPDGDDIRVELAHLFMRLQDYAQASEQFEILSTRSDPKAHSYALYWRGLADAQLSRCAAAEQALSEVLQLSGGRDGWAMLALARVRAICPDTAADSLQQAAGWAELLHRQHAGPETAETLAMIRAAQKRYSEAAELQAQAVDFARQAGYANDLIEWMQVAAKRYSQSKAANSAFAPGSPLLRDA